MQEKNSGRIKSESRQFSFRMNKITEEMLNEIKEFTGSENTGEAIRLCIFTFYHEKMQGKFMQNKP